MEYKSRILPKVSRYHSLDQLRIIKGEKKRNTKKRKRKVEEEEENRALMHEDIKKKFFKKKTLLRSNCVPRMLGFISSGLLRTRMLALCNRNTTSDCLSKLLALKPYIEDSRLKGFPHSGMRTA